jgi:antitoxin component YwqK of YwqJK toxin-antitoxin module
MTGEPTLTRLHVVDRNGLSEIISNRDRLARYEGVDFSRPQPYQQVSRTYAPNRHGHVHGLITSYYPNGQIQQSLQVVDGRALGLYQEWHPNGQQRIQCQVVGGLADLEPASQQSYLFDGLSEAWDADGNRIAAVSYDKGALDGDCVYYHSNGQVAQQATYHHNQLVGEHLAYHPNGQLASRSQFVEGKRHGSSVSFWPNGNPLATEEYVEGLIKEARYLSADNTMVAQIVRGEGRKAHFEEGYLARLEGYREGVPQGRVDCFDKKGHLVSHHRMRNGLKHGEEVVYFIPGPLVDPVNQAAQPKLSMQWVDGVLQGTVRTWYSNGTLESCRELAQNKRNGIASGWFRDGSLMLMEEYENGKLVKGDYYRRGETNPVSRIDQGKGIATLFDGDGHLLRRINYRSGIPVE